MPEVKDSYDLSSANCIVKLCSFVPTRTLQDLMFMCTDDPAVEIDSNEFVGLELYLDPIDVFFFMSYVCGMQRPTCD